ncbi:MAG: acyl-CoA thioesterase II, partial [Propionibacterium sp.]|nr:acyl-CoA thioesterase II [Propionibacterium sp.]
FHGLEPGLDHADPMPTEVPTPDKCPRLVDVMDARFGAHSIWHEWDALDVRFAGDSSPGGSIKQGRHVASMRVWVKTEGELNDDFRIHQAVLAYLSDLTLLSVSTVPHPVVFMSSQLQTASIDHAVWFHRDFRADDWLLYDMFSPSASSALGFSNGRLFQHGKLVASCAQEGLIRQVEARALLS